jgi:hypothetical protein
MVSSFPARPIVEFRFIEGNGDPPEKGKTTPVTIGELRAITEAGNAKA